VINHWIIGTADISDSSYFYSSRTCLRALVHTYVICTRVITVHRTYYCVQRETVWYPYYTYTIMRSTELYPYDETIYNSLWRYYDDTWLLPRARTTLTWPFLPFGGPERMSLMNFRRNDWHGVFKNHTVHQRKAFGQQTCDFFGPTGFSRGHLFAR